MENKSLAEWRKSKYWSQGHLAKEAGIDKGIISRVESGKQGCRIETAKKIADALEIVPEQVKEFAQVIEGKDLPVTSKDDTGRTTSIREATLVLAPT